MLWVTPRIALNEEELTFFFVRASGPGGQHVNKAATAVQLRFNVQNSRSLPTSVRDRLATIAAKNISSDGTLIITAQRYRSQERNRKDAVDRLSALIRRAAAEPKKRRPTRPTAKSREERLKAKQRRGSLKNYRKRIRAEED